MTKIMKISNNHKNNCQQKSKYINLLKDFIHSIENNLESTNKNENINEKETSNENENTNKISLIYDISQGQREEIIPNTPNDYAKLYTGKYNFNIWFVLFIKCLLNQIHIF